MDLSEIRAEALQIIFGGGYWKPVCSNETFSTNPLRSLILWHNEPQVSKSTQLCLLTVGELLDA